MFGRLLALICLGLLLPTGHAQSDDILDLQIRALKAITDSAASICNVIKTEGSSESVELSGNVKAELAGVAKKLTDLGISGAGKYTSEKHDLTVLQQDLSDTIKSNADCRKGVLELLKDKLIPDQPKKSQVLPRVGVNITFAQVGIPGMSMEELNAMGQDGNWSGNEYKLILQNDSLAKVTVGYKFDGQTSLVSQVTAFADYTDIVLCRFNFNSGAADLKKYAQGNSSRETFTSYGTMLFRQSSLYGSMVVQSLPIRFSYSLNEIRQDGKNYPEVVAPISESLFYAGKLYSCGLQYLSTSQ
jgi:hypothetical protein